MAGGCSNSAYLVSARDGFIVDADCSRTIDSDDSGDGIDSNSSNGW